jgi:D-psicose/D-tagatose/L-ribulose 3-epimerase
MRLWKANFIMAFKYSVVCDTLGFLGCNFQDNPEEILRAIKSAGYDGADLPGDPANANSQQMRQLVESIGLAVPAVLGAWAYFHSGEDRDLAGGNKDAKRRGIAYSKCSIDYSADLGAKYFSICASQPPVYEYGFPKLPVETMRNNFIEALQEIQAHAVRRGITILLEPLNCYEAYPQVLTSVYNAIEIIEKSGLDHVGIQPDIFHMNISESSMTDAIRAAGKYVGQVHVNETNHYAIGTGHADYPAIMRALKDIEFDGYLSVYMPLVSQELFQLGFGYGASDSDSKEPKSAMCNLMPFLEWPINYLKQVEKTIDKERENYDKH